jgi:hypothetical protein
MPVEIKFGQTVNCNFFQNLEYWVGLANESAAFPTLIYSGDWETVRKGVRILGWDKAGLTLEALVEG